MALTSATRAPACEAVCAVNRPAAPAPTTISSGSWWAMGPSGIGVAPPVWLHHPASLAHDVPGHPERPERLIGLESAMEANDWFGWRRMLSPPATREQLL